MSNVVELEIPKEVNRKIDILLEKENRRAEDLLLEVIKGSIERKFERFNDSFFEVINTKGSGLTDVGRNHDKYLYEKD
ncbi:MAG: hypothetical protein QME42_05035 [bacterium]|nr:hypothetical protein [bacterium]